MAYLDPSAVSSLTVAMPKALEQRFRRVAAAVAERKGIVLHAKRGSPYAPAVVRRFVAEYLACFELGIDALDVIERERERAEAALPARTEAKSK